MKISNVNRKDRKKRYGVRWEQGGKTTHEFFQFKTERDGRKAELDELRKKEGPAVFELTAEQARAMRSCIQKLGSVEAVILAVNDYEKRNCTNPIQIKKASKEHLDEAYNQGRNDNWMRASRKILQRFAFTHEGTVDSVTKEDAIRWIQSLQFAPVTITNHAKKMKSFYNWCIEKGYARENPFQKIPLPDVIPHEPEFLKVKQMEALMQKAQEHYPDAVAYFALNGFAGIRSSACARIEPSDINFKQRGILIRAVNAKNKRRVYIDGHPDNLWQWLLWAKENAPEGFSLSKRLWDRRREQVQDKAELSMPHNALRHSFCTYHVALHGDAGKTATLLTHRGNVSILYEHYRGNTSRSEAEKYFSIAP